MRVLSHRSSLSIAGLCLLVCLASILSDSGVLHAQEDLRVNYTAGLFGYYRMEAPEIKRELRPGEELPSVETLLQRLESMPPGLLVSMGDNYAPEFGASLQLPGELPGVCSPQVVPLKGHRNVAPETFYKTEHRIALEPECDNVTRFLMRAGYRAIVPGREDFIYSARWLRDMSLLLSKAPKSAGNPVQPSGPGWDGKTVLNKDHALSMLSANLRVTFKVEGESIAKIGAAAKAPGICPLLFESDPLGGKVEQCVAGGITKQSDWVRRLDATFSDNDEVAEAMNRNASHDGTFRIQLVVNQVSMLQSMLSDTTDPAWGMLSKALKPFAETKSFTVGADRKSVTLTAKPQLTRPMQGSLTTPEGPCGGVSAADDADVCLFSAGVLRVLGGIDQPAGADLLLTDGERRAGRRVLLRRIAMREKNVGYTVARSYAGGPGVLLVGLMGVKTMQAVSPNNLALCTTYKVANVAVTSADIGFCDETRPGVGDAARLKGTVMAVDPRLTLELVLRGAAQLRDDRRGSTGSDNEYAFSRVVVLAQMPRTEAEELSAHVRSDLASLAAAEGAGQPVGIDLMVSEGQADHATSGVKVDYLAGDLFPVMTPHPVYDPERGLVDPVSSVTLTTRPSGPMARELENTICAATGAEACRYSGTNLTNLRDALYAVLPQPVAAPGGRGRLASTDFNKMILACRHLPRCEDSAMIEYLFEQMQRGSHADVVMLERRDFFMNKIDDSYVQYGMCDQADRGPSKGHKLTDFEYCRLRVGLDRVLWKGDLSERVMVDGKTLKALLGVATDQTTEEQTLEARDTSEEWLVTGGVVTKPAENLVNAVLGPESFVVPSNAACQDPSTPGTPYCVNGQTIVDDRAYYLATSDHLAQEGTIYKLLASSAALGYHTTSDRYLTGEIADEFDRNGEPFTVADGAAPNDAYGLAAVEQAHQMRGIPQVEFAKLVAGFALRKPSASDMLLRENFSGVTESRAQTPHMQELDLEGVSRATWPIFRGVSLGVQNDTEYDRSVLGNLAGNPETVTYALNSSTSGGFIQTRIWIPRVSRWLGEVPIRDGNWASRSLPRTLLVASPFQYQRQLTGNFLYFPYSVSGTGQLTVHAPEANGFVQRLGIRHETGGGKWWHPDGGSYFEFGPEYSTQRNVLSGLTYNGNPSCGVSPSQSLAACIKGTKGVTVTASTLLGTRSATLRAGGLYWDVHLQKALDKAKHTTLTLETAGEDFAVPGFTLPTQTRHALTTNLALNFAVLGNLSFAPTYTTFLYANQGVSTQSNALVVHTFTVSAKWFFARDAAVPLRKNVRYAGPVSGNHTSTAKIK